MNRAAVDAFFDYIGQHFGDTISKPFITLWVGNHPMDDPACHSIFESIMEHCAIEGYELAITVNPQTLVRFTGYLSGVRIREIKVRFDGRAEIPGDKGAFGPVESGFQAAIDKGFPIRMQIRASMQNVPDLLQLAQWSEGNGWLDLGPELLQVQPGGYDDKYSCGDRFVNPPTLVKFWEEFARLADDYPVLKKLIRPGFLGIRHLVATRTMVPANFDSCPAAKTQWVFDYQGAIYGCPAARVREQFQLGTFYPEVSLNPERIQEWQNRNVLALTECRDCLHSVICGGGCVMNAVERNGKVGSPDCRPVRELVEVGVDYYKEEIRGMVG